jgi:hypothetical protein
VTRTSFDALVTQLGASPTTYSERELLEPSHWSLGEDARLREDMRFRETPWGRWMLAADLVANESVYRWLHAEGRGSVALDTALGRAAEAFGRRCVFCTNDPRFVLRRNEVHLAASELSRQPVVEREIGELEKYQTHLPLHSLKAAAASEPAGEWGARAQDRRRVRPARGRDRLGPILLHRRAAAALGLGQAEREGADLGLDLIQPGLDRIQPSLHAEDAEGHEQIGQPSQREGGQHHKPHPVRQTRNGKLAGEFLQHPASFTRPRVSRR